MMTVWSTSNYEPGSLLQFTYFTHEKVMSEHILQVKGYSTTQQYSQFASLVWS